MSPSANDNEPGGLRPSGGFRKLRASQTTAVLGPQHTQQPIDSNFNLQQV